MNENYLMKIWTTDTQGRSRIISDAFQGRTRPLRGILSHFLVSNNTYVYLYTSYTLRRVEYERTVIGTLSSERR